MRNCIVCNKEIGDKAYICPFCKAYNPLSELKEYATTKHEYPKATSNEERAYRQKMTDTADEILSALNGLKTGLRVYVIITVILMVLQLLKSCITGF